MTADLLGPIGALTLNLLEELVANRALNHRNQRGARRGLKDIGASAIAELLALEECLDLPGAANAPCDNSALVNRKFEVLSWLQLEAVAAVIPERIRGAPIHRVRELHATQHLTAALKPVVFNFDGRHPCIVLDAPHDRHCGVLTVWDELLVAGEHGSEDGLRDQPASLRHGDAARCEHLISRVAQVYRARRASLGHRRVVNEHAHSRKVIAANRHRRRLARMEPHGPGN
eukprot:scaffold77691_cov30-Tisochrysis_lutea.AAC.11